ncbi:MAG: hypothetical protein ACM3YE_01565, partial [Bacteroidota bacterium]
MSLLSRKRFTVIVVILSVVLLTLVTGGSPAKCENEIFSPYTSFTSDYNGVTYEVPKSKASIDKDLDYMKNVIFVNTVNVYNILSLTPALRDHLFDALQKRGMKIVIRLETYDPAKFGFYPADAKWVLDYYRNLIQYTNS